MFSYMNEMVNFHFHFCFKRVCVSNELESTVNVI